jgi:enoyl-CoA hydratase/carnithine racemase
MTLELDRPFPQTAVLTFARPDSLNALDEATMAELYRTLDELGRDRATRVVVLTGQGRAFCAGQDIKDFGPSIPTVADGPAAALAFQEYMSGIVLKVRQLPQPVIAAVNGVAVGAGMALACASDIRIAAPEARFGNGAVRLGLSGSEMGLSYHLPRLVGMGPAAEWLLTGRMVDADEALRTGLVNRVVPREQLLRAAGELAAQIIANAPFGVRLTKQVMWQNVDETSLERAVDRENRTQIVALADPDADEARAALLERRPPRFSG